MIPVQLAPPTPAPADTAREARLREAALQLEASFLKEMLEAGGLGRSPVAFGGGAGEDQFASFLLEAQAMRLARAGGVGLAESLFRALRGRDAP
jgi:Rod binding domain-containing protein